MALFLCQDAHRVGEAERVDKIGEDEGPLQALNAVSFHECPIGDMLVERSTLLRRDSRSSPPAGLAFHVFQFAHVRPIPDLVDA